MKCSALITILALGLATVALTHAGEPMYLPEEDTSIDQSGSRSPQTALAASLAGTVLPIAAGIALATGDDPLAGGAVSAGLIGFGVLIGPSLGYAYGGVNSRGMSGVGIRAAAVGVTAMFGLLAAGGASKSQDEWLDFDGLETAMAVGVIGATVVGLHALYDIGRVSHHVQKRNRELARGRLSFAPAYFSAARASGIRLTVEF